MADDSQLNQSEIEALLKQAQPASAPPPKPQASDGGGLLEQNEIEALLAGAKAAHSNAPTSAPPSSGAVPSPLQGGGETSPPAPAAAVAGRQQARPLDSTETSGMPHGDIEYLFNQAQQALESVDAPRNPGPLAGIAPFRLEEFSGAAASTEVATLELIRDVELDLKIELGRTQMYLEDVLKLRKGSVVPLDKLAGDPVDIYVNGRLIARGEVLVLNDNFCVRVAELITAEQAKAG